MTIDSNHTVRPAKSRSRKNLRPPEIYSASLETGYFDNDERLFLCPEIDSFENLNSQMKADHWAALTRFKDQPASGLIKAVPGFEFVIVRNRLGGFRHDVEPRLYKKLPKCLAFKGKIYYNNVLFVVGLRLMHWLAKLRKVAEVFITDFNYLVVPHIANSKRTVVAK